MSGGELVERVALALFDCTRDEWMQKSEDFRSVASKDVRRAIAAMREPTEAMVEAVGSDWGPQLEDNWRKMIDEALK